MKSILSFAFTLFLSALFCCNLSAQKAGNPNGYLKGYLKTLKGGDFSYHSPQPNVSSSLLIRSVEQNLWVEWETEPVPVNYTKKEAKFIFLAAIDVNRENAHKWDIYINDKKQFTVSSPENNLKKIYNWTSSEGYNLEFRVSMNDQFGDQHGYMILTAPEGKFEKGKPLRFKIEGESANSQTWFMIFKYAMEPAVKMIEEQAVTREGDSQFQQIRVEYVFMGDSTDAVITTGDLKTPIRLKFGYNTIRAKLPVVTSPKSFQVTITADSGYTYLAKQTFKLDPVVPRTIHLLHHSHNDIGYTHVQEEVKQIQWKNLETAMALAEASQSYPPEARFRWNSEVIWPVETYLREQTPEKAKALKRAISKGWIDLDAFYSNTLTELCTSEELVKLTEDARRIAQDCGVPLRSAMITDIPGWSWGIVPVLAGSGVKYLSLGTNSGDRIGSTIKEWGDRPFYWVSPSGEEKILCWIHEKAYSLFHTGLKYDELKYRLDEGKIFGYMNELYANNYPYEIITLRYNIGSDNGPADPTLSDAVKLWNEKYVTPKIKIMTVTESFSEFENKYGGSIPTVTGAFTGYWEDGAASSALETAINRKAATMVNSSATLMVMNNNKGYNEQKMKEAWRSVLLFDEHTWGSWNSISDPENPFTLSQWATKRQFALDAEKQSGQLLSAALLERGGTLNVTAGRIEVINTHSWEITDMVTVPKSMVNGGVNVSDLSGKTVISQQLSTGEVVFIAERVPPLGSKIYLLSKDNSTESFEKTEGEMIENSHFILVADEITGAIKNLYLKEKGTELNADKSLPGLNTYQYVAGRFPSETHSPSKAVCEITEDGPVTKILKVTTTARGSKSITNYYQLIEGLNKVVIRTTIDKEKIYKPEGVHLAFPFNIQGGTVRIDLGFGIYRPEYDQLKAACKNYFTPEKWVDVSNQNLGVTLVTNDAPMIEVGEITTDANSFGWLQTVKPSQTVYSYVMNNYWGTNYKATQEGPVTFRYSLHPHGMFISQDAEKRAAEESDPLIVAPANEKSLEAASLFRLKDQGLVVTGMVPLSDGYLVRLFNAGARPSNIQFEWREKPSMVYFSDFDGKKIKDYIPGETVPAWALRTVRIKR